MITSLVTTELAVIQVQLMIPNPIASRTTNAVGSRATMEIAALALTVCLDLAKKVVGRAADDSPIHFLAPRQILRWHATRSPHGIARIEERAFDPCRAVIRRRVHGINVQILRGRKNGLV